MSGTEKLVIKVCWGPRRETAAGCARRWLAMQQGLAALDPGLLGRWVRYREEDDGTAGEQELGDVDVLRRVIEDGAHVQDDPPGGVIPGLGFGFTAATGRRGAANDVFFSATAGLWLDNPGLVNQAHLEVYPLPAGSEGRWALLAQPVLGVLVAAWEPDCGEVSRWSLRRAQRPGAREPIAGYVTYLSAGRCRLLPAPGELPGTATATPDGGLLLSLVRPGGRLPAAEEIGAAAGLLRAAGALAPVPGDRPRL